MAAGRARTASRQERVRPLNQNSRILSLCSKKSQRFLQSILPKNQQDDNLRCVFSTSTDGWNMDSLYRRTLRLAPCVLLLRSLQQNVIIGAYLSGEHYTMLYNLLPSTCSRCLVVCYGLCLLYSSFRAQTIIFASQCLCHLPRRK